MLPRLLCAPPWRSEKIGTEINPWGLCYLILSLSFYYLDYGIGIGPGVASLIGSDRSKTAGMSG